MMPLTGPDCLGPLEPEVHEDELISFRWHAWNHLCRRCLVVCEQETTLVDCFFEQCTLLALFPVELHGYAAWDTTFRVAPGSAGRFAFSYVSPRYFDGITLDECSVATVGSFVTQAWWRYWYEQNQAESLEPIWPPVEALTEALSVMQQQDKWRWEAVAALLCERLGDGAHTHLERCLRSYLIDPAFLSFFSPRGKDEPHELGELHRRNAGGPAADRHSARPRRRR